MRTFGIRQSLAAAALTAIVLSTAPASRAADDKKTTHREAPKREAPARPAQQAPRPAPSQPAASRPSTSAPSTSTSSPRYTPRDPRNTSPNTPTTPSTTNPSTIDRSNRQGGYRQPSTNPTTTTPSTTNNPTVDRTRQGGFDRNSRQGGSNPTTNPATNQPNVDRSRQGTFNPNNNQNNNRQGTFNPNNNRNVGNNSRPASPGFTRNSAGRPEVYRSRTGNEARFSNTGRVQTVQGRGILITHGAGSTRRIVATRPDRTVIVTNHSGHGYVQRPYAYRGVEYSHRTYFVKGRVYSSYYRPYVYRGISFNAYVPVRFYSPGFYGYVYRPWARPISFRWGWYSDPWYGYYGSYFSPLPYYASPSLWLVDYIVAQRLAEAYNDRGAQQAYVQGDQQPLTPEIRQAIADEVQAQLQAEGQTGQAMQRNDQPDPSQAGLSAWFSDGKPHTFIASFTLDVTDDRGQGCVVTRGDVLQLNQAPPPDAEAAYVRVMSSKAGDCRSGTMVAVGLQDLQDIQNQMRESVSAGLGELQSKAGQNGIPPLPPDARQPPTTAAFAEAAPPPDTQVAAELAEQVREADQVEKEVLGEAKQEDASIGTQEISLGQSIDQVVSIVGRPQRIANLGSKQVYIYADMKVTFVNGKVTDVQ